MTLDSCSVICITLVFVICLPSESVYIARRIPIENPPSTQKQVTTTTKTTHGNGAFMVPEGVSASQSATSNNDTHISDLKQTKDLLATMFNGYDKRIRPRFDQSQSVVIRSSFVPLTIIELNTQEQIFTINGYFKFHWTDELLQQGMETQNQRTSIRVPIQQMWIPKIKIEKDLYSKGLVGSPETDIALIIPKSDVMWYPEGIYSVACQVDITHYPYDQQRCTFTYYVDDEDASRIQLELLSEDISSDMNEYIDNAEWKIVNTSHVLRLDDNIYYIDYRFTLERREQFATFTLVVPALSISLLCSFTFLVPIDSGEKVSLSMNVFLACCVYMTVLIDLLPHNSLTYSTFLLYIDSLLCVSVLLNAYSIIQSKVHYSSGRKACTWLSCSQGHRKLDCAWNLLLKWQDIFFFGLSSIALLVSYCVLAFLT